MSNSDLILNFKKYISEISKNNSRNRSKSDEILNRELNEKVDTSLDLELDSQAEASDISLFLEHKAEAKKFLKEYASQEIYDSIMKDGVLNKSDLAILAGLNMDSEGEIYEDASLSDDVAEIQEALVAEKLENLSKSDYSTSDLQKIAKDLNLDIQEVNEIVKDINLDEVGQKNQYFGMLTRSEKDVAVGISTPSEYASSDVSDVEGYEKPAYSDFYIANKDKSDKDYLIYEGYSDSDIKDALDESKDGKINKKEQEKYEKFIKNSLSPKDKSEKLMDMLCDFDFVKEMFNADGSDLTPQQREKLEKAIKDRYIVGELSNEDIRNAFNDLAKGKLSIKGINADGHDKTRDKDGMRLSKDHNASDISGTSSSGGASRSSGGGGGLRVSPTDKTTASTMSLEQLEEARNVTQNNISTLQEELKNQDSNIENAEQKYTEAEQNYKDELEKAAENDEDFKAAKEEVDENLKQIDDLESQKSDTQNTIDDSQNSINEANANISNLSGQISAAYGEIATLKQQAAQAKKDENSNASGIESQITAKENEIKNLETQKAQEEQKLADAQAKLSEAQTKLAEIEAQLTEANAKKQELDEKVSQLAQEKDTPEVKAALDSMNNAKAEVEKAKNEKQNIQTELTEKQTILKDLDAKILEKRKEAANKDYENDPLAKYNEELGKSIAEAALQKWNGAEGKGLCAAGVYKTLKSVVDVDAGCQNANKFNLVMEHVDSYQEYTDFDINTMSNSELNSFIESLPAGAIVNWGGNSYNPYGHVGILDGNGHEISDHVNNLGKWYAQGFHPKESGLRVYIPV